MYKKIAYRRLVHPIITIIVALNFVVFSVLTYMFSDKIPGKLCSFIFAMIFVGIVCVAILWIIRYYDKANKLAESLGGGDDVEQLLAGRLTKCGAYHFFTDDSLITLEIPAQIFYSDITQITSRKVHITRTLRYRHELFIRTQNGENYFINHFNSGIFDNDEQNFKAFVLMLEIKNPGIKNGGSFPSSSEIFKALFS